MRARTLPRGVTLVRICEAANHWIKMPLPWVSDSQLLAPESRAHSTGRALRRWPIKGVEFLLALRPLPACAITRLRRGVARVMATRATRWPRANTRLMEACGRYRRE